MTMHSKCPVFMSRLLTLQKKKFYRKMSLLFLCFTDEYSMVLKQYWILSMSISQYCRQETVTEYILRCNVILRKKSLVVMSGGFMGIQHDDNGMETL